MSTDGRQTEKTITTVGILFPGHGGEEDYPRLEKLLGNVRLPVAHTALHSERHTLEIMRTAGNEEALIEGALKLADEPLDSVMWASASGSFAYGWAGAEQQAYNLYEATAVPASSTSFAFISAIQHLKVSRVAIASSYPRELTDKFTEFLAHKHITVAGVASGKITTASAASEAGKQAVSTLVQAANNQYRDAEAIVLPDTALHTIEWLDELEKQAGKPVLTANQVTVWYGLKLAGDNHSREKLGALFA